jgi:hydroxypyruvate isomerase
MNRSQLPTRRNALRTLSAGALATVGLSSAAAHADEKPHEIKGRIKQSLCKWCYDKKLPLEKLAIEAKKIGYQSIELLVPKEFPTVKAQGLTCAILGGADIANGLNRKENHEKIVNHLREFIEFAAKEGIPNVICMSGNRRGMPDDVGLENCTMGLKQIVGFAEEKKVTLCMEGLNSKVDHKDYMYDFTKWGVELCKRVGSERFKLLYDIYHMQIMEGDVIRTIKTYKDYIGHYHTGGNPGRHEIDDTQELNYSAISKAIIDTGFKGFMAQEFIPVRDTVASLKQAFGICDV